MMYAEFVGVIVNGRLDPIWTPIFLADPDIIILKIEETECFENVRMPYGMCGVLRVYVSDEDGAYLTLKYLLGPDYIFNKV
jgi:hypothetical protein